MLQKIWNAQYQELEIEFINEWNFKMDTIENFFINGDEAFGAYSDSDSGERLMV